MKCITAMTAIAGACFLVACGPKIIQKRPVSQEAQFKAIRLMAEGDQLLHEEKEHLAMLKYLEASQLNPYEEMVFNKLAIAYSRLRMYYQARRAVNRAIGLNREYAYAYNTEGILNLADENSKAATNSFRRAIELKPDVASFHVNLGFAEVERGNAEEALRAYERAQELEPGIFERKDLVELDLRGPVNLDRYYKFGLVFAELGELDLCLWYLKKAIASGFDDYERLLSEPLLQKFNKDEKYQEFLRSYGVVK